MKHRDKIVDVFCQVTDPVEMDRFLGEILTEAERHDLALRWKLMEMIEDGMSQREVAAALGISLCKITRGSRVLKKRGSVCRNLIKQHSHE
ncbi:MAG: Trp family transcriptional regulator [Kiritimatiellia bacterium]|jgi:TrpR family trp operon transcriptional repressor|nr:Trp family transcriptional regulator [Kiritimatiellia bacterium]MDP6810294.1 Trp family transcriptional regulator [Kiritimatiellia bacterium]MDP7022717.1 Trp family transcriptional regulator [Kiritimatiellia bacterium]